MVLFFLFSFQLQSFALQFGTNHQKREKWRKQQSNVNLGQLDSLIVVLVQILFLILLFFFSFSSFCFVFSLFWKKKERVWVDDQKITKIFWLSFHFKIHFFLFFLFWKGGTSLCLWGFLCPLCLQLQGRSYSDDQKKSSSKKSLRESQFERYPPWSCRGILCSHVAVALFLGFCCCTFGNTVGRGRHSQQVQNFGVTFEYYCSSRKCCCSCCCCCGEISIEDCLIGHFCCCCSIIQVTMAMEERFRMRSKVKGNINIKRAHWKERKKYWWKIWAIGNGKIEPAQIHQKKIPFVEWTFFFCFPSCLLLVCSCFFFTVFPLFSVSFFPFGFFFSAWFGSPVLILRVPLISALSLSPFLLLSPHIASHLLLFIFFSFRLHFILFSFFPLTPFLVLLFWFIFCCHVSVCLFVCLLSVCQLLRRNAQMVFPSEYFSST